MKSYLERKERRREITNAIIILLGALVVINYGMIGILGLFESLLGIISTVAMNIIMVYYFCLCLGIIKPLKKEIPSWLSDQLNALEKMYDGIYENIHSSQSSSATKSNNTCPKCGAESESIVNKIRQVKGEIDGDFIFGFGSVDGEIDTESVNHCNKCGNEWEKQEMSRSDAREATMSQILRPMYYFFSTDQDNNSDELKKFSAKAVKMFIKKHDDGYKAEELKKLSEKELRKYGCQ